jgi:hypothetical protein
MKPELVKFELPTTDQFSVAVDTVLSLLYDRLVRRLGLSVRSGARA